MKAAKTLAAVLTAALIVVITALGIISIPAPQAKAKTFSSYEQVNVLWPSVARQLEKAPVSGERLIVRFDTPLSSRQEAFSVLSAFWALHPDYFAMTDASYGYLLEKGRITGFAFTKNRSLREGRRLAEPVVRRINEISEEAAAAGGEFNQLKRLSNILCDEIEYTDSDDDRASSLQGALLDGRATCIGYTMAFMACANKLGIPCENRMSLDESHCWNAVMVSGRAVWLNVDVTWTDTCSSLNNYFLVSDWWMNGLKDHKFY